MTTDVFIAGAAMTPFARHNDRSMQDLAQAAALGALKDADIGAERIQALYNANVWAIIKMTKVDGGAKPTLRDRPESEIAGGAATVAPSLVLISKHQLSLALEAEPKAVWFDLGCFDQEPSEFQSRYAAGGVWNRLLGQDGE